MFLNSEEPDIFCCTETWLNSDTPNSLFCPDGYHVIRWDRDSKGGGVMLIIRDCFSYRVVKIPNGFANAELVCVDLSTGHSTYRIIVYYRSGGFDLEAVNYATESIKCLHHLCSIKYTICLCGDFNLPAFNWTYHTAPNNSIYRLFLAFFNDYGFHQFVTTATRHDNILDLVFSNDPQFISSIEVQCPISTSDHNVIVLRPNIFSKPHNLQPSSTSTYNFKKANYLLINEYLSNIDWNTMFQFCPNVDFCWNEFKHQIYLAIEMFVPKFPIFDQKGRKGYPHYINKLIIGKAKLWQIWKKDNSVANKNIYYRFAKNCAATIKTYHQSQELQLLKSKNIGQLYKYVNKKMHARSGVSEVALPDGTLTREPLVIANTFNNYFSSVFTNDDGNNPVISSKTSVEMPNIEFTPDTVFLTLLGLKSSLSAGPDGIPNLFLKNCASALATPLSHIFDASFKDQKLPLEWKIALVTPIHKKGPTTSPENYRPISITSSCCRAMERIINKFLMKYLLHHNLIECSQHGFIPARSTTTNILECTLQWTDAIQNKQNLDIIYLDFRKAFDSVSHVKLMYKMSSYGLSDNMKGWLKDFLKLRSQRVNINGFISDEVAVTSGVPQGSVLGPTLFLLYINDLPSTFANSDTICKLFADDVKLYNKSPSQLQYSLNRIVEWSKKWQLQLAPDKCQILSLIGCRRSFNPCEYWINSHKLTRADIVRDLGVLIDSSLHF